ncbi:extracellular solute-binding protein [Oceaniglobus roseus]|uniref:extracellular solute-binding protein n=1 Tax=Oceaniglobus roseus TaxID=1737570 RepID=UPI001562165C|nr:extracellular solute-binding protein [Kandeliimicrobium roseum]
MDRPLDFVLWNVRPDTVQDNVDAFVRDTGTPVGMRVVEGDYHRLLGAEFATGRGPDLFYAQRAEAALWGAEGHVAPLDPGHPALAPALSAMDPRLVEGARDGRGRLLGLTYYNGGPFALFLREGLEPPATWPAFLDLMRRCKRDGLARHPFVPRWHATQTGLAWSLLCHLATEGVFALEDEAAVREVLDLWAALLSEDLVPPESLDDAGDAPALHRWASGAHCATFTMDYLAADALELSGAPVGVPVPLPGRTGTPLMPGHALLCLRRGVEGQRRDDALALMAWLGGEGVHRRWHRDHFFPVACDMGGAWEQHERLFPAPVAKAAVARIAADRARAVCSPVTRGENALDWSAAADREIRAALRAGAPDLGQTARRVVEAWHG